MGLTNAAGTLVERYTYSAYGTLGIYDPSGTVRTSSTYANRYTYTGREWDAELNLYHFRTRWYDSSTGGFISRDPLGYIDGMSLYRGYFGVQGVDPSGLLSIVQDTAPPADPKTGRVSKRLVFGTTAETMGVLDPRTQFPNTGIIANFWGENEAKNVDDYYVIGCPDLDKYGAEVVGSLTGELVRRSPTSDLADRSVDIILIRASPFRCCELREVCRVCRDGCMVIYTFADFPRQNRSGLTMPADQTELWKLAQDCTGDRFGVGGLVRPRYTVKGDDGTTVEIDYWGFWFTLKAGECPQENEGENLQCP